jgi:hypothetical protein
MNKFLFGFFVFSAALLTSCSDSSNNSNVYSCDQKAEGYDEHVCYESTEADFMDCRENEKVSSTYTYKHVYTPGRGCAEGALVVCDAEVFPGHPYKVYVYSKEMADLGCRRIAPHY